MRFISLLGMLLFIVTNSARAEYLPPGEVKIKTIAYQPESTKLERGRYHYSVTWQGIPVGEAIVAVDQFQSFGGESFAQVTTTTETSGIVRAFYRLRHRVESIFRADNFRPLQFVTYQTENSKTRYSHVSFSDDGSIEARLWKNGKNDHEANFKSDNPTFDPVSAAFFAKSLAFDIGEKRSFDVFNGKHRYLITFTVLKREQIRVAGKVRDTFKVQPEVQKLTDTEGEKRFRSAYLWISADESREVLKLKSEVLLGSITGTFRKFEKAPTAEPIKTDSLRARLSKPNPKTEFVR